jgi:hypothetical protein
MLEAAYADLAFIISLKRSTLIFSYPQAGRPITPSLEGNVLQTSSLRRESAIIESGPVGHGVLVVVVAPLPAFLAVEAGARPDHPIIGS